MDRLLNQKLTIVYFISMAVILTMASFNIFYRLGDFPIYSWDEARHGVSAFEMIKNGNFIVNTYREKNDYWNLKPPLSFWTIILGYKLAGFNELGLRICSAIFSMGTITMVSVFLYKKHGKLASLISTLVMATSTQFLINHSSRTGDADALYVFLFTFALLSLLLSNQNCKWLCGTGIGFSLAFLTKSWHAGIIVLITTFLLILTGKYKNHSFKNWLIVCLSMSLPILAWGAIRYHYDSVMFFKNMLFYDLLDRSTMTIEHHTEGKFYYIEVLYKFFRLWIVLLIFLLVLKKGSSFKSIPSEKKYFWIGVGLWILLPSILFSFAQTRIRWYILPIYPALSIMIGVLASSFLQNGRRFTKLILIASILSVAVYYEMQIFTYLNNPVTNPKQSLIEEVKNNMQVKGALIYKYQPFGTVDWLQSEVLTAELAGNLQVKNGDFTEFLNQKKALLMISKEWYSESLLKSNQLKILASNQWGYIVYKKCK